MADETPFLGLRKPTDADYVNVVADIAHNMDLIDDAVETIDGIINTPDPPQIITSQLIWNFRGELVAIVGTPYYPFGDGEILRVRINVRIPGPAGVVFDLYKNGVSMFPVTKPQIAAGGYVSTAVAPPDGAYVEGDKLEPAVISPGGAVDLMAVIEFTRSE